MHSIRRAGLTLTALSLVSAASLLVSPLAYAHHDHEDAEQHRHGQNDARPDPRNTMVDRFVGALNNQVKLLERQDFDNDHKDFDKNDDDGILAAEMVDIEHVRVLSLATLTSRLN